MTEAAGQDVRKYPPIPATDPKVGHWYWVAGQGPMKVEVLPDPWAHQVPVTAFTFTGQKKPKRTVTLITPGGMNY
jgi:hypothetical protein